MTRRYNKPVGNDPLSIPKVALRFLIGFCVGELEREEKYLPGHPRPFKHKKPTENIMVEPICPCESAADFASKVWLSVPKLQRLALIDEKSTQSCSNVADFSSPKVCLFFVILIFAGFFSFITSSQCSGKGPSRCRTSSDFCSCFGCHFRSPIQMPRVGSSLIDA